MFTLFQFYFMLVAQDVKPQLLCQILCLPPAAPPEILTLTQISSFFCKLPWSYHFIEAIYKQLTQCSHPLIEKVINGLTLAVRLGSGWMPQC